MVAWIKQYAAVVVLEMIESAVGHTLVDLPAILRLPERIPKPFSLAESLVDLEGQTTATCWAMSRF